jgi:hypothetical protein
MTDQETAEGMTARVEVQQQEQFAIANAALRGAVPRLYANGFILAQSASDISIILLTNGAAVGVLSVSLIAGKTLATELSRTLGNVERALGETIPTMDEVLKKLQAAEEQRGPS